MRSVNGLAFLVVDIQEKKSNGSAITVHQSQKRKY